MRVGVVEIGSRAIRLLIADVKGAQLDPVRSGSRSVALSKCLSGNISDIRAVLRQVQQAVLEFKEDSRRHRVDEFRCFGTAALRRLSEEYPAEVRSIDDALQVLIPGEEALCSFTAAATDPAVELKPNGSVFVLDMGAGSVEVIKGRVRAGSPIVKDISEDHVSCPLGSERLSRQLIAMDHRLGAFDTWLDAELDKIAIFKKVIGADTVLLGSVPTKAAWLQVRSSVTEVYNPKLVAGAKFDREQARHLAEEIVDKWRKDPTQARRFVDPRFKDDLELNLVVSGLILLERILKLQERKNCRVSSRGTRFGFAFRIGTEDRDRTRRTLEN